MVGSGTQASCTEAALDAAVRHLAAKREARADAGEPSIASASSPVASA